MCTQALTHIIGDRRIMVEQLHHLCEIARRDNVTVRLIRPDSGWHPALEGQFYLIEFEDSTPLIHLENRRSGLFLHKSDDVGAYQIAVDNLRKVSLSEIDSLKLINDISNRMEKSA